MEAVLLPTIPQKYVQNANTKKYDKNIYSNICEMYTLINFIIA